jgi:hypothetical protein
MVDFLKFQWLCAKDAWQRSFNLANAWYGLWGPVLVWVGSYLWGHRLTLPDHLDRYAVGLAFAFLGATWAGFLVARFVTAPTRLYYPNVRLADSPAAIALFENSERAKLIALLAEEKLSSWARIMANTAHDFTRLKGSVWAAAALQFIPKSPNDTGHINQTYLRQRPDTNAAFYDICMNYAQLKRAWPSLNIRRSKCDII